MINIDQVTSYPQYFAGKPEIKPLPIMAQQTPMTLVPQQDNMCCHTTETAVEQPEECHKELKMPLIQIWLSHMARA